MLGGDSCIVKGWGVRGELYFKGVGVGEVGQTAGKGILLIHLWHTAMCCFNIKLYLHVHCGEWEGRGVEEGGQKEGVKTSTDTSESLLNNHKELLRKKRFCSGIIFAVTDNRIFEPRNSKEASTC